MSDVVLGNGSAAGKLGLASEQRLQLRLVTVQDELNVGVALDGLEQRTHDNAWAGIAAHGIY